MLLVKLIKIAFLLKDLELAQFFTDKENIDIKGLVKHLESIDESIIVEIARIATDDKSIDNEIDAVLALTAFFLPLVERVKTSPHLQKVLSLTYSQSLIKNLV